MNKIEDVQLQKFAKGKKQTIKKGGRAVIYIRVSSREQEYSFSPETQKEMCYKWAQNNNYEVVKCFEGEHESAKSDINRKRFNTMLNFVMKKSNRIDAVIVYMTSRFSRTGQKSFSIVDELKERGITIFSATSSYDARTPEGEWMQGQELLQARHDNAIKSKAVIDSGRKALYAGRWITQVPKGYDMKTTRSTQTITINQDGYLIRQAFEMKANENLTNEEVRKRLKSMGLDLTKQQWSRVFHNIFYAGYYSHPFLEGEIIKGKQEPLISLETFLKVNNIVLKSHNSGYEVKSDKKFAPLLGLLKCPVCGHNMTAALSTKMKKKYGREVGYYTCSRKGCKCNASTKKVNGMFEDWLESISIPEVFYEALEGQLKKAFYILNKNSNNEVAAIKGNLTSKENEIEQIQNNLALATSPKIVEACLKSLEKKEAEREDIINQLNDMGKNILNLNEYIAFSLGLKDNLLKLWQLSNLAHKRIIQNLIFPDGLRYNKENEDIEPLSKNEFLFTFNLDSSNYEEKENGQTLNFEDLSALAPLVGLEPTTP